MKNCPKCGSSQKMSRKTCSECGAKLDYPAKHDNPFDLGVFGKVMVVIDILGVIAAITIMYFFIGNNHVNLSWCVTSIALFILAAIDTGIPELNWHFYELGMEFKHGISNDEPSKYYLFKWKLAVVAVPVICFIGLSMYLPHLI